MNSERAPASAGGRIGSREKPAKVLILGSSALKIGEAGEFDYSGSQAIKALREEGIRTVLVNPNIATIQTSEGLADEIYFLPVTPHFVERVIEKERPDAILLSFGGQTALNCGVALDDEGVLERFGVKALGTPLDTIRQTEDRALFAERLKRIDVKTPRSAAATSTGEALAVADRIGYPVMLRIAYALGGLGSGRCRDPRELSERADKAFAHTGQVLVEEWLYGWKEVEYEVLRDAYDNCIAVCNMENLDPLGIHTGESIVVAPSQTLTDYEYHRLREIAIRVVRDLGVVGECNVQFGLDPRGDDYRVIEVNARLSRSSALASKATAYPLAFVAAKLALGYALQDIRNNVTGITGACFEPALDYVVVKAPRWDLKKFRNVSPTLGSAMKSVGEVMAIGRSFQEAIQKAMRMLDVGLDGVIPDDQTEWKDLEAALRNPQEDRVLAVMRGFITRRTVGELHEMTRIDRWFLQRLHDIHETAVAVTASGGDGSLDAALLADAKRAGFSDAQLARLCGLEEDVISEKRRAAGIHPVVKRIDTLAAEYPAQTNYLYLTYNGSAHDVDFDGNRPIMVLGSGAYRIGSSVEFDWCGVNAINTLRRLGHQTIMLNCNPETVSTDYDEADRLYLEEISTETICEIHRLEDLAGVIVFAGGQKPNNLAQELSACGIKIIGTAPESIDRAEDRHKFSTLCDREGIAQPPWTEVTSVEAARAFAAKVGYPVLVRPSYVLSGAAMAVAEDEERLRVVLERAVGVSPQHPTVLTKFIEGAKEIEIDAVARDGEIIAYAICEHVENAGVHSGDATLVLPPQRTYLETMRRARLAATRIARALRINGPFNIQFLALNNRVRVIECNLRASRSFPFASKALQVNLIDLATRVALGHDVQPVDSSVLELDYVAVKAPQFSFTRLDGADPLLGVEMASTGEVACLGADFEDAFLKAMIAVGYRFPLKRVLLSTGPLENKVAFLRSARALHRLGAEFFATSGTARFLSEKGMPVTQVGWPLDKDPDGGLQNVLDLIRSRSLDLVVNVPKNVTERELANDYLIRRTAVDHGVPLITDIQLAERLAHALEERGDRPLEVASWRASRTAP